MKEFPKISIITPSFNQVKFLEKTILSVLNQNYCNLEYIIVDGGSTDGSLEIIKKYEKHLAWWISKKDNGQTGAINKGLRQVTGTWVGWQNSDDIYYKNAFYDFASVALKNPDAGLIFGNMMLIDENENIIRDIKYVKPTYKSVLAEGCVLANQSAFWRTSLHQKIGYLNERYQYSFDYEWFLRVLNNSTAIHINKFWGAYRIHKDTKSTQYHDRFLYEFNKILFEHNSLTSAQIFFYKIRRLFLMIKNREFYYVFRGILKRIKNKKIIKLFYTS
jgi:glycosyltransferase involved in cell wall biosynthesis